MKIKSIQLTEFRSHHATGIAGLQKINLFVGKNAAGKSSILDAISFALTGVCRGVDEGGKGIENLIAKESGKGIAKPMEVVLETDKGTILRHSNEGPRSKAHTNIVAKLGLDQQILKVISAPINILRMPPRKQQEIFFSLTGSVITKEALIKALQESGFEIDEAMDRLIDPEARRSVLENYKKIRVEMKRRRDLLVFTPSDSDLPEYSDEEFKKIAASVVRQRGDVDFEKGKLSNSKNSCQELESMRSLCVKQIEDFKAPMAKKLTSKQEKDLRAQIEQIHTIRKERKGVVDEYNRLAIESNRLADEIERIKELSAGQCSSCGQAIKAEHIKKLRQELEESIAQIDRQLDPITAGIKASDTRLKELNEEFLNKQLAAHEACEEQELRSKESIKRLEAEIDRIDTSLKIKKVGDNRDIPALERELEVTLEKFKLMELAKEEDNRRVSIHQQRTQVEDNLEKVEQWIKALGPGGIVTNLMANDGTKDLSVLVNAVGRALGIASIDIKTDPWEIRVNDLPLELISASEEFRVAMAFSIAFAKKSGARILLVDAAEILFGEIKDLFNEVILGPTDDFDQVFITMTSENLDPRAPMDDISFYLVEKNGPFSAVKSLSALPAAV